MSEVSEAFRSGARIWILSDIHSNRDALEAALSLTEPNDPCVFLGDLLTYGCHPNAVLDRVAAEMEARPCLLVWGNHEQLYRELSESITDYYDSFPDWLREIADWTRSRVDHGWLEWSWVESAEFESVFLAHANPYGSGDWSYVNSRSDHVTALAALREAGHRVGVIGHTHRAKVLATLGGDEWWVEGPMQDAMVLTPGDAAILNVGSVGQPRDLAQTSTVVTLQRSGTKIRAEHHRFTYDAGAHLDAIRATGLSPTTIDKLCSFFGE